jgi:acid phosphatase
MKTLWVGVACGAIGLLIGYSTGMLVERDDLARSANPQLKTLDANLYMETSAQYAACCRTIYRSGADRLEQFVASKEDGGKPLAVVMDLDETVLDNSGFQAYLDRESLNFSQEAWDRWESNYPTEVRLVPGAKAFIDRAEALGVTVIYITNRKNREATIEALAHNKIETRAIDQRLFTRSDTDDKTARRQAVAAKYRVVEFFGDNLRDFSEDFKVEPSKDSDRAALRHEIDERYRKVEGAGDHWGFDWYVLANPVYGEWQKLYGKNPRELLRTTGMK